MKKGIIILITFLSFIHLSVSCREIKYIKKKKYDIILDRLFENGIFIQGSSSANSEPLFSIYPFGENNNAKEWYLPQWGTRYLLTDTKQIKNDTIIYRNIAKRIYFYKAEKHPALIGLEVFGSHEYETPRKLNEDWVHLLLEQKYEGTVCLQNVQQLNYSIKAKLQFCENRMGNTFHPNLHTAQVTQFFTIQNRDEKSPNFGDFFWFGLPLYDYRYQNIEEYAAQDLGKDDASKKFIFSVASNELFDGSLHDKHWKTLNIDILPLIKKAFYTAQKRGYMKGTVFEELYLTSMNIGWEVPGTFDCGILFETPSLEASSKSM